MKLKNLFATAFVFFISLGLLFAAPDEFAVSGTVFIAQQGKLSLSLFIEEGTQYKFKFVKSIDVAVGPDELKQGKVTYAFPGVTKGVYAIKVSQDVNGNGQLDSGLLGPVEPWGTFRRSRPLFSGPKWEEMAFPVEADVTGADIHLD